MAVEQTRRQRRWLMWTLIVLIALAAAGFGVFRYAVNHSTVSILDKTDALFGGTKGARVAVSGAKFGADPAQRLDVIVPDGPVPARPYPVVVFLYGGGWRSGVPEEYHFVGRMLAREGFVVVLSGYRLWPQIHFPAMLEDGAASLRWTYDHIGQYGGDREQIQLMGHSAGAYNAAMLALDRQWLGREGLPDGLIKGVVGLAGPYDFYPYTSDSTKRTFGMAPHPELTQPVHFARADAPPMLLANGAADTLVHARNAVALAKALTNAGAPTRAVLFDGMSHEGILMKLAHPFDRDLRVKTAVLTFLRAQCVPTSVPMFPAAAPNQSPAHVQAQAQAQAPSAAVQGKGG